MSLPFAVVARTNGFTLARFATMPSAQDYCRQRNEGRRGVWKVIELPNIDTDTLIERLVTELEHADTTNGCCCCGSMVADHGYGDGHSPVDSGSYHAQQIIDEAREYLRRSK